MKENQICARCGKHTNVTQMSRFNTDILCPACIAEEKKHPMYALAAQKELEAVRRGDYNFFGIGWPPPEC